jgi:hypothetical protein
LGTIARADTRFPYILFVSQANTEAVDIALQISDEAVESLAIAVECSSGDLFRRHRLHCHRSISNFTSNMRIVASSWGACCALQFF